MSEDSIEDKEKVEGVEEKPTEEETVYTCEGAREEILKLIVSRQEIENKLLVGFDRKLFKEKKKIDRKIRGLFEDFSICDMQNEPDEGPTAEIAEEEKK